MNTRHPRANRRRFLGGIGGLIAAASLEPARAAMACPLTPSATEGPFYLDDAQLRGDIRDGRPGQPLKLRIAVVDTAHGCAPVPGALVSIWHCDAEGNYSGEASARDTTRFLRGVQPTGADGVATFTSIYPGWYRPRAVHIHFKVLIGKTEVLTSQLYFDDALNREVLGGHPAYRAHGAPSRPTARDPIAGSSPNLMEVRRVGGEGDWLEARYTVGIARA